MPTIVGFMILALVVVIPSTTSQKQRRLSERRNRPPEIHSFGSSKSVVDLCPFVAEGSCSSGITVTLEVKASDPDDDQLTYKYSVSAGAIVGLGAVVKWDLTRAYGLQTATVEVSDQRRGKASSSARVDVVECSVCDPPCTLLKVNCASQVTEGETAVFEATISGETFGRLTYLWSHSGGNVLKGKAGSFL